MFDLTGDGIQPLVDFELRPELRGCVVEWPMVELSQSPSDIPARRADASALSRTDGSIPSTLNDTRAVML